LCSSPNDMGKHTQLFSWHPSHFWIPEMSWKCETIQASMYWRLKQFYHFFQVINLDPKYIVWLSERQASTMGLEFPELPHAMLLVLIWCKDLVEFWMAAIPFEKQRRHLTCFLDWFWYITIPIFWETCLNTRIKSLRIMIMNMKEGS
jgi:hypothetical protein